MKALAPDYRGTKASDVPDVKCIDYLTSSHLLLINTDATYQLPRGGSSWLPRPYLHGYVIDTTLLRTKNG